MGAVGADVVRAYCYMALWVALSAAVILLNKWILARGFPFPLALSALHMAFASGLSAALLRAGLVAPAPMPAHVYVRGVLPVGVLFAASLWASNAAYLHLSVSFIQMLKATTPLLVYAIGAALGAEAPDAGVGAALLLVVGGVLLASAGEVEFVPAGVALQAGALCAEATRLVLVQLLLQRRGVRLDPINTLYHVAPVCFFSLLIPFAALEAQPLLAPPAPPPVGALLASAGAAFALNASVFLLVGRTSALTMNVAGVVKDWLLIGASVALFGSVVTRTQLLGYSVALVGVLRYNYHKVKRASLTAAVDVAGPKHDARDAGAGALPGDAPAGVPRRRFDQQPGGGGGSDGGAAATAQMQPLLPAAGQGRQGGAPQGARLEGKPARLAGAGAPLGSPPAAPQGVATIRRGGGA